MKKMIVVVLAILLAVISVDASAQSRRTVKAIGDVPTANAGVFVWRHYGVNKLVPDNMIPAPAGVELSDRTQIINIVMGSTGYERANGHVRQALDLIYFDGRNSPAFQKFFEEYQNRFARGQVTEKCVADGERASDYPMASGSKPDRSGNPVSYIEGPGGVINRTGGVVCGQVTTRPIQITDGPRDGEWVNPILYRQCRNLGGFRSTAPSPETPLRAELVGSSGVIANAVAKAVVETPLTHSSPVVVKKDKGGHKTLWWVLAGVAVGGTVAILASRGHGDITVTNTNINNNGSVVPVTSASSGKPAVPLPPRPNP